MNFARNRRARWYGLLMAAAAGLSAGCAGLRCPCEGLSCPCLRIDPSGERCFLFAKDNPVPPVASSAAALPPVAGNVQAPPVTTDPVFPPIAAAPAVTSPGAVPVAPASVSYPQLPQDKLSLTPGRILAPVGSEVVMKASICTPEGYTLANQRVEWMLGRNGVGQFVETGGKGVFHPPLIPWNRGEKVDNYLANGFTADGPLCIDRGTADPTDDVAINRGDAWISVTSPNEGTSHVTAFAPDVESWDLRRANSVIYWVDVQWTFPPPSVASSGRGETLTTVVTRQTDGTPLEGWIVRYEVADGGVVTGGASEVRTGADGRASVQVAPTAAGAASSQVNVTLLRPAGFAGSDAPQLVVGTGTTVISWGSGTQPYLPPTAGSPSAIPTVPAPSSPPIQQNPITPPPALPATGRARLEMTVTGAAQATVGGPAPVRIAIRNSGDAAATGIVLNDKFTPGLTFPAKPRSEQIERTLPPIPAGQSYEEELPFEVTKSGRHCHTVTLSYADGAPVSQTHCVTVAEAPAPVEGQMTVSIEGPTSVAEGQTAQFTVTVKNTGQVALMNIVTEEEYPPAALRPQPREANVQVVSGIIARQIPRLEVGQQQRFEVPCAGVQATQATVVVRARAETDTTPRRAIETADEHTIAVTAAGAQPPGLTNPAPAATGTPLSVVVSYVNPTVLVGARSTVEVTIKNKSTAPQQGVILRVFFPPNVAPDPTGVQGPVGLPAPQLADGVLSFQPVAVLAVEETIRYVIPINPLESGIVPIIAQAASTTVRDGAKHSADLEIISNRR